MQSLSTFRPIEQTSVQSKMLTALAFKRNNVLTISAMMSNNARKFEILPSSELLHHLLFLLGRTVTTKVDHTNRSKPSLPESLLKPVV